FSASPAESDKDSLPFRLERFLLACAQTVSLRLLVHRIQAGKRLQEPQSCRKACLLGEMVRKERTEWNSPRTGGKHRGEIEPRRTGQLRNPASSVLSVPSHPSNRCRSSPLFSLGRSARTSLGLRFP